MWWLRPASSPAPAASAVRFATFNIEHFPQDSRQVEGAFDEIAALDADFVAVQEITDAEVFAAAARRRLGAAWRFVHDGEPDPGPWKAHHVGVVFDGDALALVGTRLYDHTRMGGRGKPVLEVRLRPRTGPDVRVLVVHLKSGSDGRDLRERQLDGLVRLLRELPRDSTRTVVLGDFNATEPSDREQLADVAHDTKMTWATRELACSAFWDRDDGCPTSRLDHVLTWDAPRSVEARGACADGCERRDACPLYTRDVSDHCPVLVAF
jgi:endonuclease/exonuclease/phosphatase family metal-dependent hydrolase